MTSDLDADIKKLPGVINAVVFRDRAGHAVEIQVFTRSGTAEAQVRRGIADALARRNSIQDAERIFVFELAGGVGAQPGVPNVKGARPDWAEAPPRSHAKGRPQIGKISLAGVGADAKASVSLIYEGKEVEGLGKARKTTYALRVTAAATLEAAQALAGSPGMLALEGVSLVEALGRQVVIVLAHSAMGGGRLVLGASLVGDGSVHEATVKAALDAVNRQLELAL